MKASAPVMGSELNRILVGQVQGYQKKRWIIVPDGILHFLPFEALPTGNGDFVVANQVVSYSPSATAFWALRNRRSTPTSRTLLAVGDVDYASRYIPSGTNKLAASLPKGLLRDLAELAGSHLTNLPESRREVLSIAQIVGSQYKVLLGREATESALKADGLPDYRIIHLAVHSISDSHYPDRSALVLAAESGKKAEDGLLQVREIVRMRLHADLVTLSACQTAVGPMEGEAGVISLQTAFLIGGAKAVVASLWSVEDEFTTLLMEAFYRHLGKHEDKATALALAKRELLQQNPKLPAYFWAGFTIVGEAGLPIPIRQD